MPKTIYVDNTDLTFEKRFSFLTEDVIATGTTFRIQSIVGFESLTTSSGQVLCIGEIGNERTEIVTTSSATGPSSSYKEITLSAGMAFDHTQDTKVYIIDWNRADLQWSATATGTKSTIRAYPLIIQPDQHETLFVDTSQTSGFYFVRFNETVGNTNSSFSDPIPFGGYDDNSVFSIKQRAIDSVGEEVDGNIITHKFLNESLWEARREYHQAPGKRPFRREFNTIIGTALTGSYRIELPLDAERPYTAENIYGVRIGTGENLGYIDKKEWDFYYQGKAHSTLDVPYTRNTSTSLWLVSGGDFSQSATISMEGTNIGVTRITGSKNSFTITSHGNWSASAGSDAWENVSYGLPNKFTVFADPGGSAHIYFNQPIDTAYIDQNIYADYYRTLLGFDSDADILDEPNYDMFEHYLAAKVKHRKKRGEADITQDSDYKLWLFKKSESLSREVLSTDLHIIPGIDHLPLPE